MSNVPGFRSIRSQYIMNKVEPLPQELDYLINELRFPSSDSTVQKIWGNIYHYLPIVKIEINLRLITSAFLNSSVCFDIESAPFESNFMLIDIFKLLTEKKLKISQPTLSIKDWYTVLYKEINNFVLFDPLANSWKVLPIIAGMFQSNELRNQLYTNVNQIEYSLFFKDWDYKMKHLFKTSLSYTISASQPDNIINLSLLSLAVVFQKGEKLHSICKNISSFFFIDKLVDLLFGRTSSSLQVYAMFFDLSPSSPDIEKKIEKKLLQKPVVNYLNKLSFLLEAAYSELPFDEKSFSVILASLIKINHFNAELYFVNESSIFNENSTKTKSTYLKQQYWLFMKRLLFSEVIVFQGILSRLISFSSGSELAFIFNPRMNRYRRKLSTEYKEISLKILHSLYYLNFILFTIGQGGFDSYNFVYYLSLELFLKNDTNQSYFVSFTKYLIGDYREVNLHPVNVNNNYLVRCKILFVLGLWENYLQGNPSDVEFIKNDIYHTCLSLVNDSKYTQFEIIEASHSVLLIYFSNIKINDMKESLNYIQLLINQFPRILSPSQLSIAIETIGKQILSDPIPSTNSQDSVEELLEFLFFKCSNTKSNIPIKFEMTELGFASAQPISEIHAHSSIGNIDEESSPSVDIIDLNKKKKPKETIDIIPKKKSEYKFTKRLIPETSREALTMTFINLVPYLPLSIFIKWLNKVSSIIDNSNFNERKFLSFILWKVLSENMDVNRSDLGINWWYESRRAVEQNLQNVVKL